jgi:hypothetical protein
VAAPAPAPVAVHPADQGPFWKICNGQVVGIVWLTISSPVHVAAPARPARPTSPALASLYRLSDEILAPTIQVGLNPTVAGITGLPSYFWVTGYDGSPLVQTRTGTDPATGLPASIELRATPAYYQWGFGDGTGVTTTSLGAAYPAASDIRHTYEVRSDRSQYATVAGYRVSLTAYFNVSYRVAAPGAGPANWVDFADFGYPPIQAGVVHDYKVAEVVSVLTGNPPP